MSKPKNYPYVELEVARIVNIPNSESQAKYEPDGSLWKAGQHGLYHAPMYFEVVDWLRDVHKLVVSVDVTIRGFSAHWLSLHTHEVHPVLCDDKSTFDDYYDALRAVIIVTLKHLS